MASTFDPTAAVAAAKYDPTKAIAVAKAVPKTKLKEYATYWRHLHRNTTVEGVHARWVYSFCSVNLSVAGHLRAFRYCLRYPPGFSTQMTERQYVAKHRRARIGGQFTTRAGGIHRFDRLFTADPEPWSPVNPDPATRDALANRLYGLGRAKVAFSLELCDPMGCEAVCLDRHLLRLMGVPDTASGSKVSPAFYAEAEEKWLALARQRGTSPFILRSCYWDMRAGQSSCRWWSYPLEPWFNLYAWGSVTGFGGKW